MPIKKHTCKFTVPIEWKQGYRDTLDEVGGFHYYPVQVSKLKCEHCDKIKNISQTFRK